MATFNVPKDYDFKKSLQNLNANRTAGNVPNINTVNMGPAGIANASATNAHTNLIGALNGAMGFMNPATTSTQTKTGKETGTGVPKYTPGKVEKPDGNSAKAKTTYTVNANNQPYVNQLNALYDAIMNRKPFQYDLNGDLLYQQLADQYTQLGQQAMRDATGTAAGLTGGYGNSYANQVGNQAYQQYLTALNQNIPELYDRALNAYQVEGDQLLQQYELAAMHPGYLDAIKPKTYSAQADPVKQDNTNTYSAALLNSAVMGRLGAIQDNNENWYYTLFNQTAR